MRIVPDTNIYIAAALQNGFSAEVVETLAKTSGFTIIVSEEILEELEQKLRNKFNWLEADIERFLTRISKIAEIVEPKEKVSIISRDPEDNKILECAIAGQADLIVSNDQDLIKLKRFRGIAIVHPKTFSWTLPEYFKKSGARKK